MRKFFNVDGSGAGYVKDIDALTLAIVCKNLGAGRKIAGEEINRAVGLTLHISYGDQIEQGIQQFTSAHCYSQ
jgi:thymidine phosphorylase